MKPMFDSDVFAPIHFSVIGVPGSQGSKTRYGKHMVEGSSATGRAKLSNWRAAVGTAAMLQREAITNPLDGPLAIAITFRLKRPASWPKAAPGLHMVKPDIDKMLRATLDALTQSGLVIDDARFCEVTMNSIVTNDWTGAEISIKRARG